MCFDLRQSARGRTSLSDGTIPQRPQRITLRTALLVRFELYRELWQLALGQPTQRLLVIHDDQSEVVSVCALLVPVGMNMDHPDSGHLKTMSHPKCA